MKTILSKLVSGQFPASSEESQGVCFVNLGLPSGMLWAAHDAQHPTMEGCSLPTYEQAAELINYCDFNIEEG